MYQHPLAELVGSSTPDTQLESAIGLHLTPLHVVVSDTAPVENVRTRQAIARQEEATSCPGCLLLSLLIDEGQFCTVNADTSYFDGSFCR
jgi:hypothetical protein